MKAARGTASETAIAAQYKESFGENIIVEETDGLGGEVYVSPSGKHRKCAAGETLLEAALNTGVWIDSSCQQGVCGSCKLKRFQ